MASDYIEETLPPHTMDAMRRHAHGCASCQSDEAALRNLCRELNVLPSVDPPLFFRDNVMAAIERQNTARSPFGRGAWWQTMLPQLGRVAGVTTLAGGAVVALAWTLLLPGAQKTNGTETASPVIADLHAPKVAAPLLNLLPGGEADKGAEIAPQLRIARVTTMVPTSGPAFDLALWMENADSGTARFNLLGDKTAYRFHLNGVTSPQTLRVPFSASVNKETVDLRVYWTANATDHTRYLFVPLPPQSKASDTADSAANGDDPKPEPPVTVAAPSERQSFGLPDQPIVDTARQIAARYNVPVTLDDVPEATHLSLTARDETALETLTRQLAPLGLQVSSVKGGLLVERIADKPSDAADAKPAVETTPEAAPSTESPASAR